MRRRRTLYSRRADPAPRLRAITAGRRRRRQPPLRALALLIGVLAALGIAALLAGADSNTRGVGTAANRAEGAGSGRHQSRRGAAARRERRREDAAISAVLRYTPFLANGTPRRRMIALSFDDGPSPYTPKILSILLRMHVPATFFVIGQQLSVFPGAVRAEVRGGFTVGDHTQNHASLPRLSAREQFGQIDLAAIGVRRLGAPFPRLFRPPYGMYDRRTIAILRELKMLMVLWSIDPGDWRRPGVGPIVRNVLANARPGAVVILHDGGGDRSQTVAALPQIVNGLRRRRFRLVSVPQLLLADPPPRHQRVPSLTGA